MGTKIQKHLSLLKVLEMSNRQQRKAIIKVLDKSQLNILCEIVYNFLNGTLPVSKKILVSLRRYKSQFRETLNKTTSLQKKKLIFVKISDQLKTLLKLVVKRFSNTDL